MWWTGRCLLRHGRPGRYPEAILPEMLRCGEDADLSRVIRVRSMEIHLIFDDWLKDGKSVYNTEEGVDLTMGPFHSGSTFKGTISLPEEHAQELKAAIDKGCNPVFWLTR